MMRSNDAGAPRDLMAELRAVLDAIPANEPSHDFRQSLQPLDPLLEQVHQRFQALESGSRRPGDGPSPPRRCQQARALVRGHWRVGITTSDDDP